MSHNSLLDIAMESQDQPDSIIREAAAPVLHGA